MKTVAIVNGVVHQVKYNQFLLKKYAEIGYTVTEYKFDPILLFRCKQHHRLQDIVRNILKNDVIHCQSGGYFPVIHDYYDNNLTKPFILETPVLQATPGTLFAGIGISKSFATAPKSEMIQAILDKYCFTPEWKHRTIERLQELKDSQLAIILASSADTVSDNRGKEHMLSHNYPVGKHARLFYDNDFKVIEDFLSTHRHFKN